jgi:hypothetical protein
MAKQFIHKRCHNPVTATNTSKGYFAACNTCDEDVFKFEVYKADIPTHTQIMMLLAIQIIVVVFAISFLVAFSNGWINV